MPIDYFRGQGGYGEGGYGGYSRRRVSSPPQYFVSYPAGYGIGDYGVGEYGVGPLESTGTGGNIGNLFGNVDGVNRVFLTRCIARRMRVSLNGIWQTLNFDVSVGPESIVFLGTIPQPGDSILVQAWL